MVTTDDSMTANGPPVAGMTVMPYGLPLMAGAWLDFVGFAMNDPDLRARFTDATGLRIEDLSAGSMLDRMIDEATGRDRDMIVAFCDWVTENGWGVEGDDNGDV